MSNIKASHIKAKILFVITVVGLFAILWKLGSEQNPHSDLNLTKGNNYSFEADSCKNFTGIEKAKCYFDEGNLNMSLKVCGNLSGRDKDNCYQGIALSLTNKDIRNVNASIGLCNNMSEGWFYCYTYLAAIVVKSDADLGIYLCNLTIPHDVCYSTIGRAISYAGVNKTLSMCIKTGSSMCYASAAKYMAGNDSEAALAVCRGCVNATDTHCIDCYSGSAKEAVFYAPDKAIDLCSEGEAVAGRYSYPFEYMCQIDAANAIKWINESAAFDMCRNLTGMNRGFCYYDLVKVSNNTEHIAEMCGHLTGIWGYELNIMIYCENYVNKNSNKKVNHES